MRRAVAAQPRHAASILPERSCSGLVRAGRGWCGFVPGVGRVVRRVRLRRRRRGGGGGTGGAGIVEAV